MKNCINGVNFIRLLSLLIKLFKFEIEKCGQILCAHKPYFLMPSHNYDWILENSSKSHMKSSVFLHVFNDISIYAQELPETM